MKNNFSKKTVEILINNFNANNNEFVISKTKNYIKKFPRIAILYNLLGSSYQKIGKHEDAIDIFKTALKIDPDNISFSNNLGNSYKYLLDYKKAEIIFKGIIEKNPKYINAYINLGNLKRDVNNFDEAINLYEKANKISPKNYIILYSLALAHQGIGNYAIAIDHAKEVLYLNPKFTKADYLISQSMKYKKDDWHYEELVKKINDQKFNDVEKINLYFSISKANDDLNKIEESFKYLQLGNDLSKKLNKYDLNKDKKLFENIKKVFQDIDFKSFLNNESNKIIFVLGMPRSGTSLVEQIISAHDDVVGGGEMPILPNIIKKSFLEDYLLNKNKVIKTINNPLEKQNISDQYNNYINYFDIGEKNILDKSLVNFFWIGFIKIFFPNSKIIHCLREPKDNCLSIYKNLFEESMKFSYDENDLVEFYKLYQDLMKFWQVKKNINLINVSYEALIANSENEIKRIIKECDLDWNEKCLFHHKNKNPIKTMSTAQARKPIYKTSIKSFNKYKIFLNKINNHL
tara:strand:+ start:309 stop:1859 length:1551 start_codon:yes stop_codon:yes gene_type:complete